MRWWAEHAWLGGPRMAERVLLSTKDGRFDAVTPDTALPPDAERLPGLVLPGLANAHSHAFHRALRGRTHEHAGSFWTWRRLMYDVAGRLDPETYLPLARAVYGEMTLAGFTVVGEFHYLHQPSGMEDAVMEAARQAGIRLTLLDTRYVAADEAVQRRFGDTDWAGRVGTLRPDETTRLGAAIHSVRAVPPDVAAEVAAFAHDRHWPLHAHVSEVRAEHEGSATPLETLAGAGALSPRFTAVHGTHCTREDVARLADAGATCCVCPTTERDLGDGIGPFADLAAAGVRLAIGTDSHAVIDGFEEARAVELDSRLAAERRGIIPPSTLLGAATAGGAASLGWYDAGRIAPGCLADFVELSLDSPRLAGVDPSLPAAAVFAATASDVRTVVVGGRTIVSGGRHALVEDVPGELAASIAAVLA